MTSIENAPLLPFVSYHSAESDDTYVVNEERKNESRTRHWAMVWWEGSNGITHTAEAMVITEHMPDFCGGLIVYSPRIDMYSSDNSWHKQFCSPGSDPSISYEWDSFDRDTMAIDLAGLTGIEEWTPADVRTYLRKSIIGQLVAEMHYHGKRGFVAADHTNGTITEVLDVGAKMGVIVPPTRQTTIGKITSSDMTNAFRPHDGRTQESVLELFDPVEFYNYNSGNMVHWLPGCIHGTSSGDGHARCWNCDHLVQGSGDCENCGEWVDEEGIDPESFSCVSYTLPEATKAVMANHQYLTRARRYFWRNG